MNGQEITGAQKARAFFSGELARLRVSGQPDHPEAIEMAVAMVPCPECGATVTWVVGSPWTCDMTDARWAISAAPDGPGGGPGPTACAMTEAWITPHVCRDKPAGLEVAS